MSFAEVRCQDSQQDSPRRAVFFTPTVFHKDGSKAAQVGCAVYAEPHLRIGSTCKVFGSFQNGFMLPASKLPFYKIALKLSFCPMILLLGFYIVLICGSKGHLKR